MLLLGNIFHLPSGPDISADLSWSPMRADYLISPPVWETSLAYSLWGFPASSLPSTTPHTRSTVVVRLDARPFLLIVRTRHIFTVSPA